MTLRRKLVAARRVSLPALLVVSLLGIGYSSFADANHPAGGGPPAVTITSPENNSTYNWNTLVDYSIVVSYQGKSTKFDEIPSDQVLLTATYVPDLSKGADQGAVGIGETPAGLLQITRSGCIGCHQFDARAAGPSFAAIARRYPQNQATESSLSQHIRDGCTGIWGGDHMPPHPDLTVDQADSIAHWIMTDAANPNASYYVGTEGAIRMIAPSKPGPNAGMMLTASYTSPDSTAHPTQAAHGQATVLIHGK